MVRATAKILTKLRSASTQLIISDVGYISLLNNSSFAYTIANQFFDIQHLHLAP